MRPSKPAELSDRRQGLVRAASACIERFGLAKTTLDAVATEAGVSRQTIYRYFADRDELLLAALLHELEASSGPDPSEAMVRTVITPADAVAALVEGMVFTLESIQENPRLSALLATEGDSVRSTLAGASRVLFGHYADDLRPWLRLGQESGFLTPDLDPDEICEWLLRVTLSLMTTPGPFDRDGVELRAYLQRFLEPVLAGPGPHR